MSRACQPGETEGQGAHQSEHSARGRRCCWACCCRRSSRRCCCRCPRRDGGRYRALFSAAASACGLCPAFAGLRRCRIECRWPCRCRCRRRCCSGSAAAAIRWLDAVLPQELPGLLLSFEALEHCFGVAGHLCVWVRQVQAGQQLNRQGQVHAGRRRCRCRNRTCFWHSSQLLNRPLRRPVATA